MMQSLISCFFITCVGILAASSHASAALQAYWDMDSSTLNGKLTVNSGAQAGNISSSFFEIGVGFINRIDADIDGTDENIIGDIPDTNRSVGFYRVGSAYEDGAFRMEGFDFTGLSNVELSFAYRSENTFTWKSDLEVDYRIGNGDWIEIADPGTSSTGWNTTIVTFDDLLDNQTNVDFQIRTISWGSVIGYLDIDNVQVNAIPEPAAYALFLALAALIVTRLRRSAP